MVIDEYNEFQPKDQQLEKDLTTVLFSRNGFTKEGKMDSLGLVNFLVLLEKKIQETRDNANINVQEIIDNKETILKDLNALVKHLEKYT